MSTKKNHNSSPKRKREKNSLNSKPHRKVPKKPNNNNPEKGKKSKEDLIEPHLLPRITPNRMLKLVLQDYDFTIFENNLEGNDNLEIIADLLEETIIILSDLNSEAFIILGSLNFQTTETFFDILFLANINQTGAKINDIWKKYCNSDYDQFKNVIHEFRINNFSTEKVEKLLQPIYDNWVEPDFIRDF